jgi:hypothetical protein
MKITAEMASEAFLDFVSNDLKREETVEARPSSMPFYEVIEMLTWLQVTHQHAAIQLIRLRDAGIELERSDGKSMGGWIAEEVSNANRFGEAKRTLEQVRSSDKAT